MKNANLLGSALYFLASQRKKQVPPTPQQPGLNQEMASLYQCEYKLPNQKAKEMLNYSPIVSFEEASKRTVDWLASQGYPVVSI